MAKGDKLSELVFITLPAMGHLLPTIELARRLIAVDPDHISALFLIMKPPFPDEKIDSYVQSLKSNLQQSSNHSINNLQLLELPPLVNPPNNPTSINMATIYQIETCKPIIRQALLDRYRSNTVVPSSASLSGFVLDMFCSNLMDVADELGGVPSYIFFTSAASALGVMFHFESLPVDFPAEYGPRILLPEETVMEVPGFENPIPMKVWPKIYFDKDGGAEMIFGNARRFRRAKGILVNSFQELESSFIQSLEENNNIPPIYPVGPIISINDDSANNDKEKDRIMSWLDSQPNSSVVFLCFGSSGSFNKNQVNEIAIGLERSGQRFLWSLRQRPNKESSSKDEKLPMPEEYKDFNSVLPEGFLDRTSEIGLVIGWAPQVQVLGHNAVGAFVSHCGWNSTLESIWFGVPMLAWPMYAEQQLNAFTLVEELGLAIEVKMDYVCNHKGANMVVKAEEIEKAVRRMMEQEEGERVRQKVKQMSEIGKNATLKGEGPSSHQSMGRFVDDLVRNSLKF